MHPRGSLDQRAIIPVNAWQLLESGVSQLNVGKVGGSCLVNQRCDTSIREYRSPGHFKPSASNTRSENAVIERLQSAIISSALS